MNNVTQTVVVKTTKADKAIALNSAIETELAGILSGVDVTSSAGMAVKQRVESIRKLLADSIPAVKTDTIPLRLFGIANPEPGTYSRKAMLERVVAGYADPIEGYSALTKLKPSWDVKTLNERGWVVEVDTAGDFVVKVVGK